MLLTDVALRLVIGDESISKILRSIKVLLANTVVEIVIEVVLFVLHVFNFNSVD